MQHKRKTPSISNVFRKISILYTDHEKMNCPVFISDIVILLSKHKYIFLKLIQGGYQNVVKWKRIVMK